MGLLFSQADFVFQAGNTIALETKAVITGLPSAQVANAAEGGILDAAGDAITSGASSLASSVWNSTVSRAFFVVLALFFEVVLSFEGWVISLMTTLLAEILSYDEFFTNPAVIHGWVAVRDLANTFLVFALIIIGFGTLLNRPTYSYKELLPKLVFAAILVNFSKVIAGIFLDFSQVVMLSFFAGFESIIGPSLLAALGIPEISAFTTVAGQAFDSGTEPIAMLLVSTLAATIFLFFVMMTLAILAVVFVFRMVMIWLLIALSPLPYVLELFPRGRSYADRWWSEYINYLIVGPLLTFFLWLSFVTLSELRDESGLNGGTASTTTSGSEVQNGQIKILEPDAFKTYIIAIAMLMGGLQLSQSMAGIASGAVGKIRNSMERGAKSFLKGSGRLGWGTTKMLGKAAESGIAETVAFGAGKAFNLSDQQRREVRSGAKKGVRIGAGMTASVFGGGLPLGLALGAGGTGIAGSMKIRELLNTEGSLLNKGKGRLQRAANRLGIDKEAGAVSRFFGSKVKGMEKFFAAESMGDAIDTHKKLTETQGVSHGDALARSAESLKKGVVNERTLGDVAFASAKKKLDGDTIAAAVGNLSDKAGGDLMDEQIALGNLSALRKGVGDGAFKNLIHKGKIKAANFAKDDIGKDPETVASYLEEFSGADLNKEMSALAGRAGGKNVLKESFKESIAAGKLGPSVNEDKNELTSFGKMMSKLGLQNEAASGRDGSLNPEAFEKYLKGLDAKGFAGVAEAIKDLPQALQYSVARMADTNNMQTASSKIRQDTFGVAKGLGVDLQQFQDDKKYQAAHDSAPTIPQKNADLYNGLDPSDSADMASIQNIGRFEKMYDSANNKPATGKGQDLLDRIYSMKKAGNEDQYSEMMSYASGNGDASFGTADLISQQQINGIDNNTDETSRNQNIKNLDARMGQADAKALFGDGVKRPSSPVGVDVKIDAGTPKQAALSTKLKQKLGGDLSGDKKIKEAFEKTNSLKGFKLDMGMDPKKLEDELKKLAYTEMRGIAQKVAKKMEEAVRKAGGVKSIGDMGKVGEQMQKLQKSLNNGKKDELHKDLSSALSTSLEK